MRLHGVEAFRAFVLGLAGTTIVEQWESHVAKVGGKVFALLGADGATLVFKVGELWFEGLTLLEGIGQAPYFARRQWVAVSTGAALSDAELRAYVLASYRMIAGKLTRKLKAELGLDAV